MKKIIVLFFVLLGFSGCKEGIDVQAPKLMNKVDLRDAIQVSSGAITTTMAPELKEVGTIKVDKISLVNDKPLINIERQEFVMFKNYPKGKVTRTYKKKEGNLSVTEIEVIEPFVGKDKETSPLQIALSTITGGASGGLGGLIAVVLGYLYMKRKENKK